MASPSFPNNFPAFPLNKPLSLGSFKNFEDAVKARKEAEDKYYGEFSYDNSQKIAQQYMKGVS